MDETSRATLSVSMAADALKRGAEMNVFPIGMSMAPLVVYRDRVTIQQSDSRRIRIGSIVAFRDPTKSWIILHRVIQICQQTRQLLTMGDCQLYPEVVDLDDVLGEVIKVEQEGFVLDMTASWVRACSYLIAKNSQLFSSLYAWIQRRGLQLSGLERVALKMRLLLPWLSLIALRCIVRLERLWHRRLSDG